MYVCVRFAAYIERRWVYASITRSAARNTRSPDPQDPDLGSRARVCHRALDRAAHRGGIEDRRGLSLSGAAPPRGARLGGCKVGALGDRPAHEGLSPDDNRPWPDAHRGGIVEAIRSGSGEGTRGHGATMSNW